MKTTIDSAGRVVIPKAIRRRLGLSGGETLQIREHDGVVELELAPTAMKLEEHDGVLVAVPEQDIPKLTDEMVRETVERSRR
jgi:AbrB family looped-hinge helix DNA binding protein